eukprot:NODE_19102_length_860_cov_3.154161.p2 GENE.NODE_19102_length_860_cov_3.154161~~NODE_19102_length_860_cov_3.154161.p2  ORF type:complete len:116 (+),score=16.90 NODE_19102_length_860_cov_3.154161:269-616(+)
MPRVLDEPPSRRPPILTVTRSTLAIIRDGLETQAQSKNNALMSEHVGQKLRQWLGTIPIGNGADQPDRDWDESQIAAIAGFAQDEHLGHLTAEDIYRHYVESKVESIYSLKSDWL